MLGIAVALPHLGLPAGTPPTGIGSWVIGHVNDAVGGFLRSVCGDLLNKVALPVLHYVLRTPDLMAEPTLRRYWLLALAALVACTGLLVAVAGLSMIPGRTSRFSVAARETLGVRLWSCLLTAAVSLPVMAVEVGLANRLADVFVSASAASGRHALWAALAHVMHGDVAAGLGMLVVTTVGVVLLIALIVLGLLRWATLWLLVVLAPVAMGFAALPGGAGLARVWWRLQVTAVFLPVANAALLGTYTAMFSSQRTGLVGVLSGVAVLALLTKLPRWAAEIAVGAEAHDVAHRLRRTHSVARTAVTTVARAGTTGGAGVAAGAAGSAGGVPRRVTGVRGTPRGRS